MTLSTSTAKDLTPRPLAQARQAGIAGVSRNATHLAAEFAQHAVRRALDLSHALILRTRDLQNSRNLSVVYLITTLKWTAIIALCVYIGFAVVLYLTQRSLMYFPETLHTSPAEAGLPEAEELTLTAADGVRFIAWHVASREGKPVILYLHGNGGALRFRAERFRKLVANGIGLVAVEYRGYGGSAGSPSEQGLIADAQAAYAFAAAHYATQRIVLWGESLGSGVAVAVAADKPVGRLILEAPFISAAAVAGQHYWYMPVRLLMKDQFRSDERIAKVIAPLLILHGVHDHVVPYAMGEQLFELANKPKHIVRFLDGGHEDLDANGALHAVGRFLAGDLD